MPHCAAVVNSQAATGIYGESDFAIAAGCPPRGLSCRYDAVTASCDEPQ